MEYGFVSLCNKDDKVLSSLLKEANNIDYLGLRKMNVRLSNIMFPFANTLMPNLVYFYYLHAIYYAVIGEDGGKENRKVTKEEIKQINSLEKVISESIREMDEAKEKGKGFFGNVKARAFGKYKNSMKLLHFFDSDWIPTFNDNQTRRWKTEKKKLHGYLKETDRYKFICELAKDKNVDEQKKMIDKQIQNKAKWLCKLDDVEKLDFIRRVIDPYGPQKGTITPYSVFSNIVMDCCGINNKPNQIDHSVYCDDFFQKKYKEKSINIINIKFDGLRELIEEINDGSNGDKYSKVRQLPVYLVAVEYSKLQLIAKLTYNMCLFDKNHEKKKKYTGELKKRINDYKKIYGDTRTSFISTTKKGDYATVFFNKDDDGLRNIFGFIKEISKAIKSTDDSDDSIASIVDLVKEREHNILGDNSRLDSGMVFDAMGDYEDTFRWEYRPEIERIEAGESENRELLEDLKLKEKDSNEENRNHNMCARYYIYELFFEK